MAIKHLSTKIQTLLCASSPIHNYKTAVEELVYNSLDANSSAIAIRLHIQDNCIQVIDNGDGITKCDMNYVGQRYMTSKTVDLLTLKCAPDSYGYRGQSLSKIIEVCQDLKITSRYKNSNKTWVKVYHKGKEKKAVATINRPSKGTTIEIQGFLYNLQIQKHAVNALTEIQDIKLFLERLSLSHSNVSISLRDNSKNDIVFQIHKSQDIYQTLLALFSIKKDEIQELQVEKKGYKVKAFIEKKPCENNNQHWIYLNGRFMPKCRLYKIVDNSISKYLPARKQTKKTKSMRPPFFQDENVFVINNMPCYFIFIKCPYNDYDMNYSSKNCTLEFTHWDGITKLLEKLIKFYAGDIVIKEIKKTEDNTENNTVTDTRDKIKEIMHRILGSTKKLGVSQMQNGVKGQMVNRKRKKNKDISISKIILNNHNGDKKRKRSKEISPNLCKIEEITVNNNDDIKIPVKSRNTTKGVRKQNVDIIPSKKLEMPMKVNKAVPAKKIKLINKKHNIKPKIKKLNVVKKMPKENKLIMIENQKIKEVNKIEQEFAVVKKYMIENKDSLLERKHILPKKQHKYEDTKMNDRIFKEFTCTHETEHHNFVSRSSNVSVLNNPENKIHTSSCNLEQSVFINDHHANHQRATICVQNHVDNGFIPISKFNNEIREDKQQKKFKTSRDLLQTILNTQQNCKENLEAQYNDSIVKDSFNPYYSCGQKLTYESHKYSNIEIDSHHIDYSDTHYGHKTRRFISKLSRDNFKLPHEIYSKKINNLNPRNRNDKYYKYKPVMTTTQQHFEKSSYSIKCSRSIEKKLSNDIIQNIVVDTSHTNSFPFQQKNITNDEEKSVFNNEEFIFNETYTLDKISTISEKQNQNIFSRDFIENSFSTYCVNKTLEYNDTVNSNLPLTKENIDPLYVCETILSSPTISLKMNEDNNKNNYYLTEEILDPEILSLPSDAMATYNDVIETSHHFNDGKISNPLNVSGNHACNKVQGSVMNNEIVEINKELSGSIMKSFMLENTSMNVAEKGFDFDVRSRPHFIPKGMSPILKNCFTKSACDYKLVEQYYNEDTYNNFARAVETNTEIFEANIDNVNNATTKEIGKVHDKLKKDNASLNFDGKNLKDAKVLGQVDNKFIAAKMKAKTGRSQCAKEHLILFDQHAVHERIRLETNLSDYMIDNKWKSVSVDEVRFKLQHDDILFLHNYKEKFEQLGLKWSVVNKDVYVTEIPEAILGKHDRQVEVIMKAVKNLILEEIEVMKTQKGSISMSPKTIMDLVFSEACRYAIKFGDTLSKEDCAKLLLDLARCKTPFQCAHGRPVMAVLTDTQLSCVDYKINMNKVMEFKRKQNGNNLKK